ncbi:MAG: hypothetical protein KI785_04685 [Devosiaceae bacterium]|nr:hypothetical protein [Devosiaceae bacterium MH13]
MHTQPHHRARHDQPALRSQARAIRRDSQEAAQRTFAVALIGGLAVIALVFATLLAATPARSHDGAGTHPPSGHLDHRPLPTCDAARVLRLVVDDAANTRAIPYQHPVDVVRVDHIHQTRHIGSLGAGLRERRWCQGRAHLADGHTRNVYYLIEGTAGFAGIRYGVESCMAGRDLWNVHGSDCSALRIW